MDNTCGYLNVSLIAIPAGMSSWETPIGSNSFSGFSVFNSLSPIWGRAFFVGDIYEAGNPLQKLHPGNKKDFSVGKIISWGIH